MTNALIYYITQHHLTKRRYIMPYDVLPTVHEVPENLDFSVGFETTKFDEKKYVINEKTGDYLGVVGQGFKCASHREFFDGVQNVMVDSIPNESRTNIIGFLSSNSVYLSRILIA